MAHSYRCYLCKSAFKEKSHLDQHMRDFKHKKAETSSPALQIPAFGRIERQEFKLMYECNFCMKKCRVKSDLDQHMRDKHKKIETSSPALQIPAFGQIGRQDLKRSRQQKAQEKTKAVTATKKTLSVSELSTPQEKKIDEFLLTAAPKPAIHPHMPDLTSILGSASDKNPSTTSACLIRHDASIPVGGLTVRAYFDRNSNSTGTLDRGVALADWNNAGSFKEAMLLGHQQIADGETAHQCSKYCDGEGGDDCKNDNENGDEQPHEDDHEVTDEYDYETFYGDGDEHVYENGDEYSDESNHEDIDDNGDGCTDGNDDENTDKGHGEDTDRNYTGIFLNTHEPFCMVTVGVQGGGKSHTTAAVLEGCLIQHDLLNDVIKLHKPMAALVLHYDSSPSTYCEAAGLGSVSPSLVEAFGARFRGLHVPKDMMTVLVSPSNYQNRRKFYGANFTVRPLLFQWDRLAANQIRTIMGLKEDDNQLYMNTVISILRDFQREDKMPEYENFKIQVMSKCTVIGQAGPLTQRLDILDEFIAESNKNKYLREVRKAVVEVLPCNGPDFLISSHGDLSRYATRCILNLLLNSIFHPYSSIPLYLLALQIVVEQYRTLPNWEGGRLLVVDEAHKFMDGASKDGLSAAIVNCARLMRHDGMRLIISTQSPKVLAPELLELVSVAVMHRFHSSDWFTYLESKLSLSKSAFKQIMNLHPGQALVFASRHNITQSTNEYGQNVFLIKIRRRVTADMGRSILNRGTL